MITKAVNQGRIKPVYYVGKRAVFDFDECDAKWERNRDPSNRGWEKPQRVDPEKPQRVEVTEVIEPKPQPPVPEEEPAELNFNQARTKRERYQAELARLEFEEKAGVLVNAEKIRREYFKQARNARDNLLNIPDRLAPTLVGRADIHEVRMIILEEIHKVCESLAAAE